MSDCFTTSFTNYTKLLLLLWCCVMSLSTCIYILAHTTFFARRLCLNPPPPKLSTGLSVSVEGCVTPVIDWVTPPLPKGQQGLVCNVKDGSDIFSFTWNINLTHPRHCFCQMLFLCSARAASAEIFRKTRRPQGRTQSSYSVHAQYTSYSLKASTQNRANE